MSEYQYYEFQAIDRPLTTAEMRQLRGISSRARISPTRFVNEYHYGDFRGDVNALMERYFDAHLYLANWGTHDLSLRLPVRALDPEVAMRYLVGGHAASARASGGFVVLGFHSEAEGEDFFDEEDGGGWMASLVQVREGLASGDHRALYLGWLLHVQDDYPEEDDDENEPEPPVPPGLGKLSAALKTFAEFLRIGEDLIAVAAERSPAAEGAPGDEEMERWVAALPEAEKTRLLMRFVAGEGPGLRADLRRGFRQANRAEAEPAAEPRTASELLAAAEARAEERRRREAERARRERERQEQERAAARERRLEELAAREAEAWKEAEALVSLKKADAYARAVALLADLREVATRAGRGDEAAARLREMRARHAAKRSFLERLAKAVPLP